MIFIFLETLLASLSIYSFNLAELVTLFIYSLKRTFWLADSFPYLLLNFSNKILYESVLKSISCFLYSLKTSDFRVSLDIFFPVIFSTIVYLDLILSAG